MIRAAVVTVGVLAAVIFGSAPVQSHHSNVAYEVTKVITVTGVVKDFQWVNPHTWLHIVVDDPKGREGRVGSRRSRARHPSSCRLDEDVAQSG